MTKKSSTDSDIWKDVTLPVDMFIEYMKSSFPVVFVDMTYDLMLNMIPFGIYNSIGVIISSHFPTYGGMGIYT